MSDTATKTELALIPDGPSALVFFTKDGAIDPILDKIKSEIDNFKPDTSSASGRKRIASMAYRVSQSKTYLDAVGKKLVDEQKKIPNQIDACRKRIRDTLDKWRDDVRAPLTEWEQAEELRIGKHTAILKILREAGTQPGALEFLRKLMVNVQAVTVDESCEEFLAEYIAEKNGAVSRLTVMIAAEEERETERIELERLRHEAQERDRIERDERMKAEAADAARKQAEMAHRAEIARVEAAAKAERAAAERRELELTLAAERAKREALEAAEKAKRDAERKAADEAAELRRLLADNVHRMRISNAIVDALVSGGIEATIADTVFSLIADGRIPHVEIDWRR